MDNVLVDGLCTVGLLYLLLHLWHSIDSIRKGVEDSSKLAMKRGSDSGPGVAGPHDHPVVGAESKRQERLSHGRLDRL
jgi:hypothetical protein